MKYKRWYKGAIKILNLKDNDVYTIKRKFFTQLNIKLYKKKKYVEKIILYFVE